MRSGNARRFLALATLLIAMPLTASAQLSLPDIGTAVTFIATPSQPSPGDNVQLTIESPVIDLERSTITWYVNGKTVLQGIGETNVEVLAGPLGSRTLIEVSVASTDGVRSSVSTVIAPTDIDIIFDSDSYVPAFYRGKPMPSAGSTLHLEAHAYFQRANGALVPQSDIIYTWKRNNALIPGVSGRGRSSIAVAAPYLFSRDTITLDAHSVDDTFSGSERVVIPSIDPKLYLYEDHPLFGLLLNRAFGANASTGADEMTFAAIPYFAGTRNITASTLSYTWTVNGGSVETSASEPNEITIRASGDATTADIQLSISSRSNLFLDSTGTWKVKFSETSANASDLFRGEN